MHSHMNIYIYLYRSWMKDKECREICEWAHRTVNATHRHSIFKYTHTCYSKRTNERLIFLFGCFFNRFSVRCHFFLLKKHSTLFLLCMCLSVFPFCTACTGKQIPILVFFHQAFHFNMCTVFLIKYLALQSNTHSTKSVDIRLKSAFGVALHQFI